MRGGCSNKLPRTYFYFLNERGQLYHLLNPRAFIQQGLVPSGPAHLNNNPKFLDFFFQRLSFASVEVGTGATENNTNEDALIEGMSAELRQQLFPFVSLCGEEINFLSSQDAPVVFTSLDVHTDSRSARTYHTLSFAGSLQNPFRVELLREHNGRLYHPVTVLKAINHSSCYHGPDHRHSPFILPNNAVYGVLGSPVAIQLGLDCIDFVDDDGSTTKKQTNHLVVEEGSKSGAPKKYQYQIQWEGSTLHIPPLHR